MTDSSNASCNLFTRFVGKDLFLEKKQVISTSICLILLFQEKIWLIRGWGVGVGFYIKGGMRKISGDLSTELVLFIPKNGL